MIKLTLFGAGEEALASRSPQAGPGGDQNQQGNAQAGQNALWPGVEM